jgi:tetratricopeptide (TPR) repeat protein
MLRARWWMVVGLVCFVATGARADDWPVPRGPSHDPQPYLHDARALPRIPKEFLDDSQACVLYSGTTHLVEPDGTVEAISHEITRLNSRKGIEKLGEYRAISYDPAFEKLTLNEARVIKANGTIVPIEPKHVQLRDVSTDFQVYDQDKQLVISFPNLEVGDAYEVKWTVRGKNREFNGEFFSRYTFGDDTNPVLRDEFRVLVPKNKTLKYATVNGAVDLKITDTTGGKLYFWQTTNRRELPRDEDRPSKEELRLQVAVSTFPTWESVGLWKQKLRAECWTCKPEVRKIIADVTRDQKTPIDKAKALTYWVRRHVRYLSRGPGGLGYTPHLPHQVLSNLYGDCKDQAQLLAVMLREIGLPVWLVTLGTLDDGQVLPAVPSPWGSHAILLTKIDGKEYWIDTTVSLAAWDFLPRADRDRQTYITQGNELKLIKTPPFTYRDYRIEQETHVAIRADGTSLCKRESLYHGTSAWTRRDKWLEVPPGERRRAALAELQDAHSKARLLTLKIDEKQLLEFDRPVRAEMEFEVPRHFTGETSREGSFTDSPIWTWLLGYNLDVDRPLPFQLPMPFESIHRYVVQIPLAYRAESIPENRSVHSPWGFFELKVTADPVDTRRLELHMHMRIENVRVEKADFVRFQHFQEEVSRSYRVWLTLHPSSQIADAPEMEKLLAREKPAEPQTVKVLAKLYLDHDRGADARRVLEKGTSWFPREKSLWELRVQAAAGSEEEERLYRVMVKLFPNEKRYAVALGAACIRRGEHAEASRILTPLTVDISGAIAGGAHYQLARSAYHRQDAPAALKHLQQAFQCDPTALATLEAMQFKARVLDQLGQPKEALQTLQTALLADPTATEILEAMIRLELRVGLRDSALDHLRRHTVAAGKDGARLITAAGLHFDLNRLDDAFELAGRAREFGAGAKAERILGLVSLHRHEYLAAILHLDHSELDAAALTGLIHAHLRLGDLDTALRRAEMIRRLEDAGKELFALEKEILHMVDRRDTYLAQWKIANEQRPAALRVINRFLSAERGVNERWPLEQVDRLLDEASTEELAFGPLSALRGWRALEKGKLRIALQEAETALKLQPLDARAHLVRGRVRLEQANVEAALADLRRATELSQRQDPVVLHWLAEALLEAGRPQEAVDTQRLALFLRPNDTELQSQLRRMESAAERAKAPSEN